MNAHCRLRFDLGRAAEEPLVAALWDAGTSGVEVRDTQAGRLEVDAFFPAPAALPPDALRPGSTHWPIDDCRLISAVRVEETDWLSEYRKNAVPLAVGRRLLVDPREPGLAAAVGETSNDIHGRYRLLLPARTAFGTGSHESTRLAVELLEERELKGRRVLDVGCGSGILAFAAVLGGARSVAAVEIDVQAALVARGNQRLNGLSFGLAAGSPACLRTSPNFDLALVNVIPEAVRPHLRTIADLVRAGGEAIFSGFLDRQADRVLDNLREVGFESVVERGEGEWRAVVVRKGIRS